MAHGACNGGRLSQPNTISFSFEPHPTRMITDLSRTFAVTFSANYCYATDVLLRMVLLTTTSPPLLASLATSPYRT